MNKNNNCIQTSNEQEFERQVNAFAKAGMPSIVGIGRKTFLDYMEILRNGLQKLEKGEDCKLPFLVVPNLQASLKELVELIEIDGNPGFSVYRQPACIKSSIWGPYLLTGIDFGESTKLHDSYHGFSREIKEKGRKPLTVYEGIILGIVRPEILKKNAFCLRSGDESGCEYKLAFRGDFPKADLYKGGWSNRWADCSYKWRVPSFHDRIGGIESNTLQAKVIITSLWNRNSLNL